MSGGRESSLRDLVLNVLLGLIILAMLFPFVWMILMSLKTQVQNTAPTPVWLFTPVLDNYRNVIERNDFLVFTKIASSSR